MSGKKVVKQHQLWLLDEQWEELVSTGFSGTAKSKYSRTMELFDHLPIYTYGRRAPRDVHRLESIVRPFNWRGAELQVKIIPARIKDNDGVERDYFPGRPEELVGDALRKLAIDGRGKMSSEGYQVSFSGYAIQKELERVGIKYSYNQIVRALEINAGTQITIEGKLEDETFQDTANIFTRYTRRSKEDWIRDGKNSKAQIKFHDLVTRSIKNLSFRQIDYPLMMSYKSNLARRLHKRISHVYTQASFTDPYRLGIASFFRIQGLNL